MECRLWPSAVTQPRAASISRKLAVCPAVVSQTAARANAGRSASKSAIAPLTMPRWCPGSLVCSMQELPPRLQVVDPAQFQPLRRLDRDRRPHDGRARTRFQEPGKLLERTGGKRLAFVATQRAPARARDHDR